MGRALVGRAVEPTGIDMDLDVVDAVDGRGIWIDDRDEWDEHRVAYGYPLDIVEQLEALAVDLERAGPRRRRPVRRRDAPMRWLDRLAPSAPRTAPTPRLDA